MLVFLVSDGPKVENNQACLYLLQKNLAIVPATFKFASDLAKARYLQTAFIGGVLGLSEAHVEEQEAASCARCAGFNREDHQINKQLKRLESKFRLCNVEKLKQDAGLPADERRVFAIGDAARPVVLNHAHSLAVRPLVSYGLSKLDELPFH